MTSANPPGPTVVPALEEKDWKKQAVAKEEIESRLKDFLNNDKPGVNHFFNGDVSKYLDKATTMAANVMKKGCKRETALELSLLALYEVVLLVGKA